jgi:hypothetical protein
MDFLRLFFLSRDFCRMGFGTFGNSYDKPCSLQSLGARTLAEQIMRDRRSMQEEACGMTTTA